MYETEENRTIDADLAAAAEDLAKAARKQKGRQVSLEEIRAYLDGELSEERQESLKNQVALDPRVARAMLELRDFRSDVDADPETLDAPVPDWAAMKNRLQEESAAVPASVARFPASSRSRSDPRVWQVAAAILFVTASATGLLSFRFRGQNEDLQTEVSRLRLAELEPRVNVFQIDLLPIDEQLDRAARPRPRTLPVAEARRFLLALNLADPGDYSNYGVEIADPGGEGGVVWSATGLRPSPLGTFNVELDRGFLAAGTYEIRLLGLEGDDRDLLGEFEVAVPSDG